MCFPRVGDDVRIFEAACAFTSKFATNSGVCFEHPSACRSFSGGCSAVPSPLVGVSGWFSRFFEIKVAHPHSSSVRLSRVDGRDVVKEVLKVCGSFFVRLGVGVADDHHHR